LEKFVRLSFPFICVQVIQAFVYDTLSSVNMPQQYNPSGQDWDPVNVGKSGTGGIKAVPKTAQELSLAKARGLVTTEKRQGAGGNQSAHSGGVLSARKLEEADDVGTIVKVDKSLSKAIMQVSSVADVVYSVRGNL
jgi:Multiprotein bridging factor 1